LENEPSLEQVNISTHNPRNKSKKKNSKHHLEPIYYVGMYYISKSVVEWVEGDPQTIALEIPYLKSIEN